MNKLIKGQETETDGNGQESRATNVVFSFLFFFLLNGTTSRDGRVGLR